MSYESHESFKQNLTHKYQSCALSKTIGTSLSAKSLCSLQCFFRLAGCFRGANFTPLAVFNGPRVQERTAGVRALTVQKTGCKRWNKQGFEGPHQTGVSFLVKCLCDFFLNVKQKCLRMSNVMCFWFYFCWQNLVEKKESVELWGIKSFLVPCVGAIYSPFEGLLNIQQHLSLNK